MGFISDNKPAIRFLLTFVILYVGLNTLYGFFIEYYLPQADPITTSVSNQVVFFLKPFNSSVACHVINDSKNVAITNDTKGVVLNVFEGCNGVNVFIVFISFVIAFRGPIKLTLWAGLGGLVIIHLMNLIRVGLLYGVEIYFPQYLYYFHKYLFTGLIYVVVFFLWYKWVTLVKSHSAS